MNNSGYSTSNIFVRGLSRMTRRKKRRALQSSSLVDRQAVETPMGIGGAMDLASEPKTNILTRGMDRLRRSLRLPRRRDRSAERSAAQLSPQASGGGGGNGSKQEQWQPDESAVRAGLCSFQVKYLGAVEVFESRGMQVCEGALKALKSSRRKPVKAVLYVSGDGLRVVDQENNRGLLVDQTIEKVSFCAPDRNNDKGFAYICRDGTSRRWMCHGFFASKESGERLSHAVGCAFAICLERKKKRDMENQTGGNADATACGSNSNGQSAAGRVPADPLHPNWDEKPSEPQVAPAPSATTPQRTNQAYQSFRKQISISERLQDPQSAIVSEVPSVNKQPLAGVQGIAKPRPSSNPALFQRQGSLRAPEPQTQSQFARNYSLRANSSSSFDSPTKKVYGTTLYNEPIYEGDEDPLGLGIVSSTSTSRPTTMTNAAVVNNGLDGLDLSTWAAVVPPTPLQSSVMVPQPIGQQQPTPNGFAQWEKAPTASLTQGRPTAAAASSSFHNGVGTTMSHSTSRSKADEWLEDMFRTAVTVSPPSLTSPRELPATNGFSPTATNNFPNNYESHAPQSDGTYANVMPKSGPPPSQPPPPLPSRQAVSGANVATQNGFHSPALTPTPVADSFGHMAWDAQPAPIPKPVDPFDVQWSRVAVADAQKLI